MGLFSVLSPLIGLFGANQQRKAGRRLGSEIQQAGWGEGAAIEAATEPMQDTLGLIRSTGVNLFGAKVGKESPILRGQMEESRKGIGAERERALGESRLFHGANVGRRRGEELRIGQEATEAENKLALGYGEAQEGFKERNRANYMDVLSRLFEGGRAVAGNLMDAARARFGGQREAAGVRAGATSQMWSDIGGIAGEAWGQEESKKERKWLERLFSKKNG